MLFLDDCEKLEDLKILLIPILRDHKKHYCQNEISFIYCFGLETYQEQIINLTHNDYLSSKIYVLNDFVGKEVYCYKRKYLVDYRPHFVSLEAELVVWFKTNKRIDVAIPNQVRQYWNWYPNHNNVNDIIPIMKWLEYCRNIKDEFVLQFNKFELAQSFMQYNQLLLDLEEIERNGLSTINY